MYLSPFHYYTHYINSYDILYKNNFVSFFQIPQIKFIYLSFNLTLLNLKYTLYSLLFLNIITLQKPAVNLGKKIKISVLIKKKSCVGCKVLLRDSYMESFLNLLIISFFPKMSLNTLTKKSLKSKLFSNLKTFSFNLNSLSLHYKEIEYFYMFFQYLNTLTITIEYTGPFLKFQLLSSLYIPVVTK